MPHSSDAAKIQEENLPLVLLELLAADRRQQEVTGRLKMDAG